MDLYDLLKKLQTIEPNRDYTETSRRVVLSTPRVAKLSPFRILFRALESSAAVLVASMLVLIFFGGFSVLRILTPGAPSKTFDPLTLRAEAEAIDIQIQLANLNYVEPTEGETNPLATLLAMPTTTTSVAPPETITTENIRPEVAEQAKDLGLIRDNAPDEATPPEHLVGVDEALDLLFE